MPLLSIYHLSTTKGHADGRNVRRGDARHPRGRRLFQEVVGVANRCIGTPKRVLDRLFGLRHQRQSWRNIDVCDVNPYRIVFKAKFRETDQIDISFGRRCKFEHFAAFTILMWASLIAGISYITIDQMVRMRINV